MSGNLDQYQTKLFPLTRAALPVSLVTVGGAGHTLCRLGRDHLFQVQVLDLLLKTLAVHPDSLCCMRNVVIVF